MAVAFYARKLYAERMKTSTVKQIEKIDVARNVRGRLAMDGISASDLSRRHGGAISYWTRRLKGQLDFSVGDLMIIASEVHCHPAELLGGEKPQTTVTLEYQSDFDLAA